MVAGAVVVPKPFHLQEAIFPIVCKKSLKDVRSWLISCFWITC